MSWGSNDAKRHAAWSSEDIGLKSSRPLSWTVYRDAFVIPSSTTSYYRNIDAGALDSHGEVISESLLVRSWRDPVISRVPQVGRSALNAAEVVEEPHIYGGYLFDHFGHFLLESMARSWISEKIPGTPFVWATGRAPNDWQSEIMSIIGLKAEHRFPEKPTLFRKLIVPDTGYRIRDFFHDDHMRFMGKYRPCAPEQAGAKVWLSRRVIEPAERRSPGEGVLERLLRERGWKIVSPETLPVRKQLDLLGGSGVVAGIAGSAFHSAVLLEGTPPPLVLLRRSAATNHTLIAARKGLHQTDYFGAFKSDDPKVFDLIAPAESAGIVDALAEQIMSGGDKVASRSAVYGSHTARPAKRRNAGGFVSAGSENLGTLGSEQSPKLKTGFGAFCRRIVARWVRGSAA